ncbi:mannose-1-phosphate guanylyltransferase/mannose-6-phosphate isomerase [Burkholderia vietnamiensis]|uniref:mannose-1-phosphate guanylyltransferase/mannose-6-phosphate isomerase n=1 Tax=Burkholderia vietnamiensis TaxID=60552 RepID=UPI000759498B|nr:mannose-1-phosphate guanylyltransferase/mannose-6-phosphate isomerase [Burkholderia vietnamiensis]KVR80344.1 mannose-1-phosphate guanyltransferase [Burkholderia vietnamiensis]MBR8008118.1 mannose-1-phosphate guanylyltransferase/mannose-6-phosphate isomerase [Burkholderia vietnamiensis]MCA8071465.1 mannose-1-phosphate guanylyltransferase/mannose-6-phosphate isomerase [Burkholderia vietnamiensis]HDR8990552.1 mannose-1-phosphate guanylyltransferase/mannose-6-phosphate isomerase [Burkholderia vi
MSAFTETAHDETGSVDPDRGDAVRAKVRVAPVILAGGSGSRLWPMSREQYPKQLIGVLGADSLLQATVQRMTGFTAGESEVSAPIVVCGDEHRFVTAEQLRASGLAASIVVEPARRDTAPALTLAAAVAHADGQDAIVVAMPADHAIADTPAFHRAIALAVEHARRGAIATLGVPPTRPDTGFGYIKLGEALDGGAHRIERFVEKPAAELAAQYVESRAYWWNSGIFVVRASVWLDTLRALQPDMHAACLTAYVQGKTDGPFFRPHEDAFLQSPADSIDYAVMERLASTAVGADGVVVPLDAGWSDLGSWDAVWEALDKDADGNVGRGKVVFEGATSSFVHSEGRLVACVGVTNAVVVETADAVLVADRSRVQDVKGLVSRIRAQQAPEADAHRKVRRPWGYYDSIDHGARFQVKRIVVHPGGRLSLQLHHHRAEHWIVVSGTALVTRGDEQFMLGENQSTFIPLGVTHRLENPGKLPLELIEVQSGSYLGEDDIVRFDDTYGRA